MGGLGGGHWDGWGLENEGQADRRNEEKTEGKKTTIKRLKNRDFTGIKRSPEQEWSVFIGGGGDNGLCQHSVGSVLVIHSSPPDVGVGGGVE